MKFSFIPERRTVDAVFIFFDGCKKSIMLNEKVVYEFCGPSDCLGQSAKVSVGMGIEEERNTRSFG